MILNPGYEILGKVSETTFFMHKEKHKINEDFGESFRANQIRCKLWLTEELSMIGTSWLFNSIIALSMPNPYKAAIKLESCHLERRRSHGDEDSWASAGHE